MNNEAVIPYSALVQQHFAHPCHVGTLDANDAQVGLGRVGMPGRSNMVHIYVAIKDHLIVQSRFQTLGCGYAIAASSWLCELIQGLSVKEAKKITYKDIARALEFPQVKLHCALMVEDALQAALADVSEQHVTEDTLSVDVR